MQTLTLMPTPKANRPRRTRHTTRTTTVSASSCLTLSPVTAKAPAARVAATRDLPAGERLVALARLARERGIALPGGAREALYRRGGRVDLEALETALAGR